MPSLMERLNGAYRGFREPALYADPNGHARRGVGFRGGDEWGDVDARLVRYRLLWAFYEQNAFRDVQGWPQQFRSTFGLYEGVRDLFGVAHQLGEFWPSHLQGGDLDPAAGDGKDVPSALPIILPAESPAVREALAELWKRSVWSINKDVASRFGAVCGDVFLEVCDDAEAGTVRLNVIQPGKVKWCDVTAEGNVEAYELEFWRPDPTQDPRLEELNTPRKPWVRYNELVTPDESGGYRWRTYMNGDAYGWSDAGPDYTIPDLAFAPLVKVQHKNIGMGWGQSEAHAAVSGMREVADLASCLTDWARRALNAPHLMAGMKNPEDDPQARARAARQPLTAAQIRGSSLGGDWTGTGQSQAEGLIRSGDRYLYANDPDARAHSLVHPMPVDGIGGQIDRLREKMREDYPELSFERVRVSGQASAEAIREARKPAEAKITARRVEYDAGAVRAFQMALTLGGLRGYRHYEPFDAGSYESGALDMGIGTRPAFAADPAEQTADRTAKYLGVKAAVDAGLPLTIAMREAGYSEEDIAEAKAEKAAADQAAMDMVRQKQVLALSDAGGGAQ
jgi:hypothetical protein